MEGVPQYQSQPNQEELKIKQGFVEKVEKDRQELLKYIEEKGIKPGDKVTVLNDSGLDGDSSLSEGFYYNIEADELGAGIVIDFNQEGSNRVNIRLDQNPALVLGWGKDISDFEK